MISERDASRAVALVTRQCARSMKAHATRHSRPESPWVIMRIVTELRG